MKPVYAATLYTYQLTRYNYSNYIRMVVNGLDYWFVIDEMIETLPC